MKRKKPRRKFIQDAVFSCGRDNFALMEYDEKICRCALNRVFGFKPAIAHALVECFGSAAGVFKAREGRLPAGTTKYFCEEGGVSDKAYRQAEKELEQIEKSGVRFLYEDGDSWPCLLSECEDRPMGLYVKGSSPREELFSPDKIFIAVVGTRDVSLYGQEWCERIVRRIASSGAPVTIVSGLAIGADIIAHRTALDCGIPTIAVMPTGLEAVYPYRHRRDAERICSTPGCALITDYPSGTVPAAVNFIRRNRIIAGMTRSTILIESKIKGGGMITARLAFSYGRDVLAMPGRIDDLRSEGCNLLVKEKIAEPVISLETLLTALDLPKAKVSAQGEDDMVRLKRSFGKHLDSSTVSLLADFLLNIRRSRGIDIESLAGLCGVEYKKALELASLLESDGMISIDLMQRCMIKKNV